MIDNEDRGMEVKMTIEDEIISADKVAPDEEQVVIAELNRRLEESLKNIQTLETRLSAPVRRQLSDDRKSITHKFTIIPDDPSQKQTGYIIAGLFEDGSPAEVVITMNREGDPLRTYAGIGKAITIGLQHGVPLKEYIREYRWIKMPPAGQTENPNIPSTSSIYDYVAKWLALTFPNEDPGPE